jgi:NAD(P)H-hydrate epimerase
VTSVPAVTASQMAEVYRISLVQMMKRARVHLARLSRQLLGGRVEGGSIALVRGKRIKGRGGMIAACHLLNWGGRVGMALAADPDQLKDVPARQWSILAAMGIKSQADMDLGRSDWLVEAVLGYSMTTPPKRNPSAGSNASTKHLGQSRDRIGLPVWM